MTKEEILKKLEILKDDKDDFIVISGASMVVQGAKEETNDIDLAVNEKFINKYKDKSKVKEVHLGNNVYVYQGIEFGEGFYNPKEVIKINGYNFSTLEDVYNLKKFLNRPKDRKDIVKLDLFLSKEDNLRYEKKLYKEGIKLIAGVDEVGRGPLVGPVVVAACILPLNYKLDGLTDSKKLSEKKREEFYEIIKKDAISYSFGIVETEEIDKINILEATKKAMKMAIEGLSIKPEHVLIDAVKLDISVPSTSIIKGDIVSLSISAASVLAKVERDRMMIELDKKHPEYNFKKNKGYPTKDHLEAIKKYGILKEHRKSYGPVKEYINNK